jgi:hypothetical protein
MLYERTNPNGHSPTLRFSMKIMVAILKYVPAVLCGLLLVAWLMSLRQRVEYSFVRGNRETHVCFMSGSLAVACHSAEVASPLHATELVAPFGYWAHIVESTSWNIPQPTFSMTFIPVPFVLTFLSPLAFAPSPAFASRFGPASPGRRSLRRSWRTI